MIKLKTYAINNIYLMILEFYVYMYVYIHYIKLKSFIYFIKVFQKLCTNRKSNDSLLILLKNRNK